MWKLKKINELTGPEFYKILKLRIDTFIVSQNRIYHELDTNDIVAYHLFYQSDSSNDVLAYARIFETEDHITFGRVVTSEKARGKGFGRKLMIELLRFCQINWPDTEIVIEAQDHVIEFYEKFGFHKEGNPFIYEGTPHIEMRFKNEKNYSDS